MPLILNTHTPDHSFALPYRKDESAEALLDRLLRKSGLDEKARQGVKEGRDGAVLQYEYEGGRWTLQDEDDLEIMFDRYPVDKTHSITLHLTPPSGASIASSNSLYSRPQKEGVKQSKGQSKTQRQAQPKLEQPLQSQPQQQQQQQQQQQSQSDYLLPSAPKSRGARSIRSTTSRVKSVHPNTGAISGYEQDGDLIPGESMGDRHKRAWKAFHEGRGVRTVVGNIGGAKNVRMLLKHGYKHVYVSRPFAIRNGFIPPNSAMGAYGYAGLVNVGKLPITVGSRTEKHTVMISEEVNFDVVLGRSWMEKMGIRTDPLDQTHVSYYDNGEVIPCDIVVLKDSLGQVITIT